MINNLKHYSIVYDYHKLELFLNKHKLIQLGKSNKVGILIISTSKTHNKRK